MSEVPPYEPVKRRLVQAQGERQSKVYNYYLCITRVDSQNTLKLTCWALRCIVLKKPPTPLVPP